MKQIAFTKVNTAELLDVPRPEVTPGTVCVRTCYSALSAGTERANITGDPNCGGARGNLKPWPRILGYSVSGIVDSVGEGVTDLKPGDRVLGVWGQHQQYNVYPRENVIPILYDDIDLKDAALAFISAFSLAAIRKTGLEIGESCLVVGLGLLGQLAAQYARIGGAQPVIAVDFSEERRKLAMSLGANFAFDPADPALAEKVKAVTEGHGANCVVEVTGNPDALNTALLCTARFGRVALLGCTRVPTTVNFYNDVHWPGITLIGAHTRARPEHESSRGWWTTQDDCLAALRLLHAGTLNLAGVIHEVHPPEDCPQVYARLVAGKGFPIGVVWDWTGEGGGAK